MIAPLKAKLGGIEIIKVCDSRVERFGLALQRPRERMIPSDVPRLSSQRHYAACCASGFSVRREFFDFGLAKTVGG
jgi:hypothetical protein